MSALEFEISPKYVSENNLQYSYRMMKNNILKMNLAPGTPINEIEVAELLHISRTPVHEAMLLLRDDRLVDVQPKVKTRVSLIDLQLVEEGGRVRALVEAEAFRKAAGNLTQEQILAIRENLLRFRFLVENSQYPSNPEKTVRIFELDNEFHQIFYQAAGMEWTWTNLQRLCSHFDRLRTFNDFRSRITEQVRVHILEEHEQLFEAVLNRRTDRIGELLNPHILRPEYQKQLYEAYREYFL